MMNHGLLLQHELAERCLNQSRPSLAIPATAMNALREGLEHFQSGNAEAALVAFSSSVAQAPRCAEARIFLGLANALTYNIYPAFDELETAAELQPNSFAAHFTLAQLSFKLRIPAKGYAAAQQALRCAETVEQRAMLTQLLKEERARERNGIARPSFNKRWFPTKWFKKSAKQNAMVVGHEQAC